MGVLCDQPRPLTFPPGGGVISASFLCVPEGSSLVHRDHVLSVHLLGEAWYGRFSGSAGIGSGTKSVAAQVPCSVVLRIRGQGCGWLNLRMWNWRVQRADWKTSGAAVKHS